MDLKNMLSVETLLKPEKARVPLFRPLKTLGAACRLLWQQKAPLFYLGCVAFAFLALPMFWALYDPSFAYSKGKLLARAELVGGGGAFLVMSLPLLRFLLLKEKPLWASSFKQAFCQAIAFFKKLGCWMQASTQDEAQKRECSFFLKRIALLSLFLLGVVLGGAMLRITPATERRFEVSSMDLYPFWGKAGFLKKWCAKGVLTRTKEHQLAGGGHLRVVESLHFPDPKEHAGEEAANQRIFYKKRVIHTSPLGRQLESKKLTVLNAHNLKQQLKALNSNIKPSDLDTSLSTLPSNPKAFSWLGWLVAFVCFCVLWVRLWVVPAAIAIDISMPFKLSWHLTKGSFWRLFWGLCVFSALASVVLCAFLGIAALLFSDHAYALFKPFLLLDFYIGAVLFYGCYTALAFNFFVKNRAALPEKEVTKTPAAAKSKAVPATKKRVTKRKPAAKASVPAKRSLKKAAKPSRAPDAKSKKT